ncbi:MAG: imidazole glycerol phosphate synthase subunit HisH [Fusobacteriaceae bacterium]
MKVAIIDSGGANINSIVFAMEKLGVSPIFTSDKSIISAADKIILPGVGAAGNAIKILEEKNLVSFIREIKKPIMGICLGMQILFELSEENNTKCLGVIDGKVKKFSTKENFPVPHMGWNSIKIKKSSPLLSGINDGAYFYFVHSFFSPVSKEYTLAEAEYSENISAIIQKENFYGCQFHPEKSGEAGLKILENFLRV